MNKLFVNSISGVLQIIITLILSIIAIPQLIFKFGADFYGALSLALLIGNISIFVNLGFNASLLKYISQQGKTKQSDIDIITAFIFLIIIIIPISSLAIYFNRFIILNILYIPPRYLSDDMLWLFNLLVISNLLIFLIQVPSAVLDSSQKIYITNTLQSIYNILNWTFILVFINISDNVVYIGLSYFLSALIWFILIMIIFMKIWGNIYFSPLFNDYKASLKKQFIYGLKIYTSGILGFFHEPFTKVLISHFIGLNMVGYYDIALRIKSQITNLFFKIYYPLYPYIAQMADPVKIRSLIHDVEQKAYFLTFPIVLSLIFIMPPLVNIWMKHDSLIIANCIIIITSGYILFSVNINPIYFYLMTKGHPGKTIAIQSVNMIINGMFFFIFSYYGNIYAPIYSNFIAILCSFLLALYYQKKYLNSLIFDNRSQLIKAAAIILILLGPMYLLNTAIHGDIPKIFILTVFACLMSMLAFRYLRVFGQEDINRYISFPGLNSLIRLLIIKK